VKHSTRASWLFSVCPRESGDPVKIKKDSRLRGNERRETDSPAHPPVTDSKSFPDAEVAEDHIEDVLDIDAAGEPAQSDGGEAKLFGDQLLAGTLRCQFL
jgi:hypothetical protein